MYVIEDLNDKKLMESFRKKSNQIEFKIEKVIKKKVINNMLSVIAG